MKCWNTATAADREALQELRQAHAILEADVRLMSGQEALFGERVLLKLESDIKMLILRRCYIASCSGCPRID